MQNNPFFSVVIPTYNRLKLLKIAIDSVLNQTYDNYNIIIVDDGSTDRTKDYINSLSNSKIKYYWQENSGLPSVARNVGVQLSNGDWIAFLDSDDYWEENKLSKVYNKINEVKDESLVAVSHWEKMIVRGTISKTLKHGSKKNINLYNNLLFNGNFLSTSALVIKREALLQIGLFDTRKDYYIVEDYDLWLRLSKAGNFEYIDEVLGNYCLNNDNISYDIEQTNENLKNVIRNHIMNLNVKNKNLLLKKSLSRIDYYKGRGYQISGNFEKAIFNLILSIKGYPFSYKKWISLCFALLRVKR